MKLAEINGWCGIVMVVSLVLWLSIKPGERTSFSWAPLPSSSSGLKNFFALLFHISWLTGLATLAPGIWKYILGWLCLGIVVVALRLYFSK